MSFSEDFNQTLLLVAREFVCRGWSVIPLQGDMAPSNGKAPALVAWRDYQRRLPTEQELVDWFGRRCYPALGIVLGTVSQLVVVDIDDPDQAGAFAQCLPDLTETFTVRSGNRGLPHYYFRIPLKLSVVPRYGRGVELRSNGQYVVAPGTRMGDCEWEIVNHAPPRLLTGLDVKRIVGFLESTMVGCKSGSVRQEAGGTRWAVGVERSIPHVTAAGLRRRYDRLAFQLGRNNALFAVAAYARDCGWSRERIEQALASVHVNQPPVFSAWQETPSRRSREACRTIASVYSRPARLLRVGANQVSQLPNGVREVLLQEGLVQVARVLDGLLTAGFEAGQQFTAAQAYQAIGRFGIGRNTVFVALKSGTTTGKALFEKLNFPSPPNPPSPPASAAMRCAAQTKQCLFGRDAKLGKKRGRPANLYQMPSIQALCVLLGVRKAGGDALEAEDLASPAAYRAALHVALIRRSPGKYPRGWQARRLGVSKDTCRRYEKQAGVRVTPTYNTWRVSWNNAHHVLPDEPLPGQFVEDETGKRYPPLVAIVKKLLARGQQVVFRWQDANRYEIPAFKPVRPHSLSLDGEQDFDRRFTSSIPHPTILKKPARGAAFDASARGKPCSRIASGQARTHASAPAFRTQNPPRSRRALSSLRAPVCSPPRVPQPLPADEQGTCAERLYHMLRNLNPQRSVTRKNAQWFVTEYGESLVERGLGVLAQRRNIHNPAGFLRVWLRSEKAYA